MLFAPMSIEWRRVGKYAIQSGEWTICKCASNGVWKYGLYQGNKLLGWYDSADEAKGVVNEQTERSKETAGV